MIRRILWVAATCGTSLLWACSTPTAPQRCKHTDCTPYVTPRIALQRAGYPRRVIYTTVIP
jgi:hypothetical protein